MKSSESRSKLLSNGEVLFNKFVRFQLVLKHLTVSVGWLYSIIMNFVWEINCGIYDVHYGENDSHFMGKMNWFYLD